MNYAIVRDNTISAAGTARQVWPNVSIPRSGPNAEFLAEQDAVEIISEVPYDPETQYLKAVEPYLLDGVVFDRVAEDRPIPPPQPRWQAFGAALAGDAAVNQLIAAAAQAAPVLHLMLGVGLGQAAQGDTQTFATAWSNGLAAGLVSPELAAYVQGIAASHDLPAQFVEGLNPPDMSASE